MYFSIEPERIRLERMMTLIPHFPPRTSGLIVPISEGAPVGASHCMLMQDTMRYIRSPDFRKRFQDYQSKKESAAMTYRGIRHKTQFEKELQKRRNPTAAMLCGLYLLTADCRLWSQVRKNVHAAGIRFQDVKLGGISPEAYALFMTATDDPISKKKKKNNGELTMYYVENSHPAIIERAVFDRAQEELARRNGKRKVKEVGTTTEQGKYSSKYALTDLLYCGECGTPYRRCTWIRKGGKKIVWRCISRLDYGTKYCKHSPSLEEYRIHAAIADAVTAYARQGGADVERLKAHIRFYELQSSEQSCLIQKRLTELEAAFSDLLKLSGKNRQDEQYDETLQKILEEKAVLSDRLQKQQAGGAAQQSLLDRIEHADAILEGLKNRPVEYDDRVIRQLVECVKVLSADKLLVCFYGGDHMEVPV